MDVLASLLYVPVPQAQQAAASARAKSSVTWVSVIARYS
jgi:hypothetical protein